MSSVAFINVVVLYWLPTQLPLSSYSAVSLMATAFYTGNYWLIPISISFCGLMFITAFSFKKQQIVLPIISFLYLLLDLSILSYSFFDSLINDEHFIAGQLMQIITNITIIVFIATYLFLGWKQKNPRKTYKKGDG